VLCQLSYRNANLESHVRIELTTYGLEDRYVTATPIALRLDTRLGIAPSCLGLQSSASAGRPASDWWAAKGLRLPLEVKSQLHRFLCLQPIVWQE
jgi:hypothetical protein